MAQYFVSPISSLEITLANLTSSSSHVISRHFPSFHVISPHLLIETFLEDSSATNMDAIIKANFTSCDLNKEITEVLNPEDHKLPQKSEKAVITHYCAVLAVFFRHFPTNFSHCYED